MKLSHNLVFLLFFFTMTTQSQCSEQSFKSIFLKMSSKLFQTVPSKKVTFNETPEIKIRDNDDTDDFVGHSYNKTHNTIEFNKECKQKTMADYDATFHELDALINMYQNNQGSQSKTILTKIKITKLKDLIETISHDESLKDVQSDFQRQINRLEKSLPHENTSTIYAKAPIIIGLSAAGLCLGILLLKNKHSCNK